MIKIANYYSHHMDINMAVDAMYIAIQLRAL